MAPKMALELDLLKSALLSSYLDIIFYYVNTMFPLST